MLRCLDDLDRCVVSDFRCVIRRQWDLRNTEGAIILLVGRASDLEDWQHSMRVVEWLVAVAHVYVEKRVGVAREPTWLNRYSAAFQWPLCTIL